MSGWQPIETAPKDGTWFLAVSMSTGRDAKTRLMQVTRWEEQWAAVGGFGNWNQRYWPATHWIPLPEPPETP
jgi:hypothetical protein